jgi:hypothetical protein
VRSNGGIIGAKKTVNTSAASGIWAIRDQQRERGASNWPFYVPGLSQGDARNSAMEIKTLKPDAPDGLYWINDGTETFQVYCDMTRNGGGWMLVASIYRGNGSETMNVNAAGVATPAYNISSTGGWGKFSDARINRMRARSQSQQYGYTGNWPWWFEGVNWDNTPSNTSRGGGAGNYIDNFVYKNAITWSTETYPANDSLWRRIANIWDENSATYQEVTPNTGTRGMGHHHQSPPPIRMSWSRHPEGGGTCAMRTDNFGQPTNGHMWVK